jgi:hypothetical protein
MGSSRGAAERQKQKGRDDGGGGYGGTSDGATILEEKTGRRETFPADQHDRCTDDVAGRRRRHEAVAPGRD